MFNIHTWSLQKREAASAFMYIGPWIIGFLIFTLGPMLASLYFSFTDYNIVESPKWVGLKNYAGLLQDELFWQSLKVTLHFAVMALPASLVFGLFLAVLLNQEIPFVKLWRTLYFLPSVITGVAVTILWMLIFNPQVGILNNVLRAIGISNPPTWFLDPKWALIALAIMSLWGIGQTMIIYLAGLQGIPTDLYDAAKVDGATVTQRFWNITLPMISPVIFYNLVLGLIATFSYFTQAYIVGRSVGGLGSPLRSTLFYNLYLYQKAFLELKMGEASAMAWVLFIVVLGLTVLVFRSSALWVYYEGELRQQG